MKLLDGRPVWLVEKLEVVVDGDLRSLILRNSLLLVQEIDGGNLQLQLAIPMIYLATNSHLALVEKVLHVIEEEEEGFDREQPIPPTEVGVARPFENRAREAIGYASVRVDAGHVAEVGVCHEYSRAHMTRGGECRVETVAHSAGLTEQP